MDFKVDYKLEGEWSRTFAMLMTSSCRRATSEAELQELVDRLDRVSCKYSLLINVDNKRYCKEQCQVHAGEKDHARPGWTTSRRGQDSPWKSQSEWQRTGINGESTSMVWPTLRSRTAKEQNRKILKCVTWSWQRPLLPLTYRPSLKFLTTPIMKIWEVVQNVQIGVVWGA